jgi:hypothetical protein
LNPRTSAVYISGVAGDEIGDDLSIGASGELSKDVIRPLSGADSVLMYGPDSCAAIKYESEYRIVYFAFGFERIHEHPALDGKDSVMSRVLSWLDSSVGVEEENLGGREVRLYLHNFPNPFSARTRIVHYSPEAVALNIYDSMGRRVKTISVQACGGFALWNGTDDCGRRLAPGSYFCHLNWGNQRRSRKMVIIE